jgi:CubicO group peptidase (beta-lactamase class C family)
MRFLILPASLLLLAGSAVAQAPVLARGVAVAGTLAAGDTARYTVNAAAGSFVWGTVEQQSVDVVVRVLGPDGGQLALVDGPATGPERFRFETRVEGAHQVQVIPFRNGTGAYAITLERVERVATDPRKLADQLFWLYDHPDTPGGEVAVFRGGKTIFAKAYGMANLAYGIPFRLDTRTNIGSTSKQFTAFAVLLLVEDGQIDLDADVRTYLPELPDLGEKVAVRNLLTHTSGYREFLNLVSLDGRRLDHGDYIDRKEIIAIVQRQPKLQNSPGAEWNYNNTAFALLAMIVERVSGMDFPDFMATRVFGPIGMTHTMVRPSPEVIVPGMAMGYTPGGGTRFRESRDLFGAMGAGGIYTTVADLQRWVENLDQPRVGSRAMVDQMMTRFVLTTGDTTSYGFGLFIDRHRGLRRINHGGADAAHRSQLIYYPDIHAGITTQSNDATFDGNIAARLADAFFAADMEPEKAPAPVAFDEAGYDPAAFDRFVGRYALDAAPDFILSFTRSGDSLFTQATGQQRVRIYPTSDSTFELRVVKASLTFHRAADGTVTGLTLHQGGDRHATRLEGEAPKRWSPSAGDLPQFAGRYFSDEVEAMYTIEVRGDTLIARNHRLDDIPLQAGDKEDTFTGSNGAWSFERDRNGRVIGLYLANGRTRDVRFARVP